MAIYEKYVGNILQLSQSVTNNPYGLVASNVLVLNQDLRISPNALVVGNKLNLVHHANPRKSINNIAVFNTLFLINAVNKGSGYAVFQILFLTHECRLLKGDSGINQSLLLTQSAVYDIVKPAYNDLVFTQEVSYTGVRNLALTSNLILKSSASYYKVSQKASGNRCG